MATSTNYGWSEPDDTSLVKDGASAMRTLGNAIDTSLWNSGYGQAGKNKIINGDFRFNQRSFTSTTTTNTYGQDRWAIVVADGTTTYTPQTFTLGAAPVAGYESINYARLVTTGQTLTTAQSLLRQRIEDVRTFAGQTVTVSFWAQSGSGTPSIAAELVQVFGTGGSPSSSVVGILATPAKQAISTSWARYSFTISVPSISGKTLGTNNDSYLQLSLWVSAGSTYDSRTGTLGIQTNTFNIWGVQVEYGSKATPFQTASGGSIQGELAACQRYYFRTQTGTTYLPYGLGIGKSATVVSTGFQLPTTMRIAPTAIDYANLYVFDTVTSTSISSAVQAGLNSTTNIVYVEQTTGGGLTQFRPYYTHSGTSTAGYIGFSAEL